MRKVFYALALLLPIAALVGAITFGLHHFTGAKAVGVTQIITCTPTGFMRDSKNLTAAVIPTAASPNVRGTINATGCNIGVYFGPGLHGSVEAEVFGANYFGVVNNGSNVKVFNSYVHNIGETPLNGTQHGVGIYFSYDIGAKGAIESNRISVYQKGGIVVTGSHSSAVIEHNTVMGQGPVNYIAQNGIEVGEGAKATVLGNKVTGNSYSGPNFASSGGILIFGGSCYTAPLTIGTIIKNNVLIGNDVGVFLSNLILDSHNNCVLPTTPTNIVASMNFIKNDAVNNTTGGNLLGAPGAYQAGISDEGYGDRLTSNKICGVGYTPVPNPPPFLSMIDVVATNPIVSGNTSCSTSQSINVSATLITKVQARKHSAASISN